MADEDAKAQLIKVLEANEAFYRAFTRGDVAAMCALWSEREELLCFHPGAYLLRGREDVLSAWHQILVAPAPLEMRCDDASAQLHGNVAVVTCYEGTVSKRRIWLRPMCLCSRLAAGRCCTITPDLSYTLAFLQGERLAPT